ncbi:MAG: ribosomal protein S18-alanine N-acetyltransferase [Magnetococcales bacterium]|nr:ribosomal protein S18-alanine N-acetyltransferase [Magnetococcales bacterium]
MIRTRSLEAGRLGEVADLEARISRTPWPVEMFRDELALGSWQRVMLTGEGAVVGYVVARQQFDEWHLLKLGVASAFRRQGLGRRMVRGVLQQASRTRSRGVLLEVRVSNLAALRLYQGMGFRPLATRPGYYRGPCGREDALVMARWLPGFVPA